MPITRPNWTTASNRGTQLFDICTGSTQDRPVSYLRDLKGCGDEDYLFFRIAENGNNIIDCVKTPVYGVSISGFVLLEGTSNAVINATIDELQSYISQVVVVPNP